jgi:hypothetical protein
MVSYFATEIKGYEIFAVKIKVHERGMKFSKKNLRGTKIRDVV